MWGMNLSYFPITAAGGLIGGFVGDAAAARYPNHGRIAVTQFSVLMGVPLSLILMKVPKLKIKIK